jgi:hypothetical protein
MVNIIEPVVLPLCHLAEVAGQHVVWLIAVGGKIRAPHQAAWIFQAGGGGLQ